MAAPAVASSSAAASRPAAIPVLVALAVAAAPPRARAAARAAPVRSRASPECEIKGERARRPVRNRRARSFPARAGAGSGDVRQRTPEFVAAELVDVEPEGLQHRYQQPIV